MIIDTEEIFKYENISIVDIVRFVIQNTENLLTSLIISTTFSQFQCLNTVVIANT